MRLIHLADLHLGHRRFDRIDEAGRNRREGDVQATFARAASKIIAADPALVIVGGDVFDSPRPSARVIEEALCTFAAIVAETRARIVIVAGNHDQPRTREPGNPVRLLRYAGIGGVHVVESGAEVFRFDDIDCVVAAVAEGGTIPTDVGQSARYRVLVMHGDYPGLIPAGRHETPKTIDVSKLAGWDYVGLGHWHVHREVAPLVYYSGSLDYTSTNPWGELKEEAERKVPGKGIVEHDLATHRHTFHPLPTRALLDLTVNARDKGPADVTAAIVEALTAADSNGGTIEGAIVRVVVYDCPIEVSRGIDGAALKPYKRRAFTLAIDYRRPQRFAVGTLRGLSPVGGGAGRPRLLMDRVTAALEKRTLPDDIDRAELVAKGRQYLEQAGEPGGDHLETELRASLDDPGEDVPETALSAPPRGRKGKRPAEGPSSAPGGTRAPETPSNEEGS